MPFALIAVGLLLAIAGARNTQGQLFSLLKGDFTGNQSFIWWSVSILAVGSVGYVKSLKGLANAFLALVLIVLVLHNKGVFDNFISALKIGTNPAPTVDNSNPEAQSSIIGSINTGSLLSSMGGR
jgi:hypothetical protein